MGIVAADSSVLAWCLQRGGVGDFKGWESWNAGRVAVRCWRGRSGGGRGGMAGSQKTICAEFVLGNLSESRKSFSLFCILSPRTEPSPVSSDS